MELKARNRRRVSVGAASQPLQNFSVEFAGIGSMPGDDLSTLDWKVYARSDRHYVKVREETNLECHLLLDVSASWRITAAQRRQTEPAACCLMRHL